MPFISTENLSKSFGDVQALKDLDLEVEEGQLYGFIGPNGAGKTTTIEILTGQMEPDSGEAEVMGLDPVEEPVEVRKRVGILPEREDPPSFLTPREYFEFVADVRGVAGIDEKIEDWAEDLRFEDRLDTISQDLSKGEKQKVMVTQAFLHEPDLVFIDEPLINLDPVIQEKLKERFTSYQEEGNTIFLSTHVMSLADQVCTHIGLLSDGHLVESGEKEGLVEEGENLEEAFLRLVE
ncbi:MAG: ABC transporter ATP-binding protein [Candidatus Nanohaloarchaea archaeon]|nr:ABC transporter ATP-binding protein [Candidatus Nanohaloarchaea archaeon]